MTQTFRIALGLCTALFVVVPTFAQLPGANDPDAKELATYQLTVPALTKVLQASKNLAESAKNDPRFKKQAALKAELKKLEAKEEPFLRVPSSRLSLNFYPAEFNLLINPDYMDLQKVLKVVDVVGFSYLLNTR